MTHYQEKVKRKPDFVAIGLITSAHGVRGELRVTPTTDCPSRFQQLKSVYVETPEGESKEYGIIRVRLRGKKIYLKLAGIENLEDARSFAGSYICIKREDCLKLPPDNYYIFDLIGLRVKNVQGQFLGHVTDVLSFPANDVYVVSCPEKELLIPAIKDVVKKIDLVKEEMIIEPIEGLLE